MLIEELLNPGQRVDKVLRKLGERNLADHHEQCHSVLNDGSQLVRRVADTFVVRDRDTAVSAAVLKPLLV